MALILPLLAGAIHFPVRAEDSTANVSTGITSNSVVGNNSQQATDTGVAINGPVSGSNLNNNQNRNLNLVQPIVMTSPQYSSGGRGGAAALVLPRNPLPLGNAALGRSNFGLQFGVQNNPGMSAITGGKENGLGWFFQGGLTIPFGKIPSAVANPANSQYDRIREDRMDSQRNVMGNTLPTESANRAEAKVQGKVVGLNAYNYSTLSTDKIPSQTNAGVGEIALPMPRVLALKVGKAFDQPLNTGTEVGQVQVGKEYPYLGHTHSGWVKILLPNGKEAWTNARFEYIKFDYTEIDALASDSPAPKAEFARHRKSTPSTSRMSHSGKRKS
jgi:hypothetical protein